MDGRQAIVAGRHSVGAVVFQMVEEAANDVVAEIVEGELGGAFAMKTAGESEEQLHGVAVGQDGIAAEAAHGDEVLVEEAAQGGSEVSGGHGRVFSRMGS